MSIEQETGWNLEPYRRDKCLHIPRGEAVLRLAGNWSLTGETNVCIYRGVRPFCGWLETGALPEGQMSAYTAG